MNKRLKVLLIISVLVLIAGSLGLWLYEQEEPDTIRMSLYSGNSWGIPQNFAYVIYDKAASMFLELPENKGIDIQYKTGSLYRHYSEWLAQLVLKGKEPDLFLIVEEDFKTYASIGLLENLTPYIEKDSSFNKDSFYRKSLDAGSYKGGQYSLPISIVPSFLIVNKSLLSEENITINPEKLELAAIL